MSFVLLYSLWEIGFFLDLWLDSMCRYNWRGGQGIR